RTGTALRSRCRPQGAVRAWRLSSVRRRHCEPAAEGCPPGDGGSMHCQVSVLYFARSAELAGLRSETLSVPRRITARQLWDEIVRVHPRQISSWFCSLETRLPSSHQLVEAESAQVLLGPEV
ncbi:molybdopterin synthase sulfur carrier subunit-like, partial [Columba livia]